LGIGEVGWIRWWVYSSSLTAAVAVAPDLPDLLGAVHLALIVDHMFLLLGRGRFSGGRGVRGRSCRGSGVRRRGGGRCGRGGICSCGCGTGTGQAHQETGDSGQKEQNTGVLHCDNDWQLLSVIN